MNSADQTIGSLFLLLGAPAHLKCFQYLREAVKLASADPTCLNALTRQLYPAVARQFGVSPGGVERGIRHAVEVIWRRGRAETLNELFGYRVVSQSDRPGNGEMIALLTALLAQRFPSRPGFFDQKSDPPWGFEGRLP